MNSNLLFDFTVDKENKTVYIKREFAAAQDLVWDAFTKPELLDQWTAPAPFTSRTKYMNFEVGGKRFYAMVSPDGQEGWILQKYTSISPKTNFKLYNVFADKDENPEPEGSEWDYSFREENSITTVCITIFNESPERMERMIAMGFKEGYTVILKRLDLLLQQLNKQKNEKA